VADGAANAVGRGGVPPCSVEAEGAVLSACLLDESRAALDTAREIIRDGDFYSDSNRWVWRAILDLDAAGQALDVVMVAKRLRDQNRFEQVGGAAYLAQLADCTPAIAHVADHAQIVADKARQRRMIGTLQAATAAGYGQISDVPKWAQDVAQQVAEVAATVPKDPPELFSELVPRVIAETEVRSRDGIHVSGVETGWREYTRALGGWKRGKLHVVGGRPGMGKSSFVLGAALNVALQGFGVVFVSLEMSKEELVHRALAVEANVDVRKIETGRLNQQEWSAVMSASSRLQRLPLSVVFKPGATVGDVRSTIRTELNRMMKSGVLQLGLVVVDYLQIMDGDRRQGDSRESEVSSISKRLTWLAGEFDVPLIGVSQLNRSVESRANSSKRPTMADLRESGAIEQDAYTVTLLYRDEYYNKDSEWRGTVEAIIGKNRGGPPQTVRLAFTADSTRIDSLEPQQEFAQYTTGGSDNEHEY
jgi:replicative DNA helicase